MRIPKFLIIIPFLLIFQPINAQDLFRWVCQGKVDSLKILPLDSNTWVDRLNHRGFGLVHFTVFCKQPEVLEYLILQDANIDQRDAKGRTAMFYAAYFNDGVMIDRLLQLGSDTDLPDKWGNVALHQLAMYGSGENIRKLIVNGARIEFENQRGSRALEIAYREGNQEAIKVLLELGADAHAIRKETLEGSYLGQIPNDTPTIFAPNFVSTENAQLNAVFHPNGKELYYSIESPQKSVIMVTLRKKGVWSSPVQAPFSGTYKEVDPFISRDGSQLFYCSFRPTLTDSIKNDPDIWLVNRVADGWSEPIHLGSTINTNQEEWYPSTSDQGTIFFSRGDESRGISNLYFAQRNHGKYGVPQKLSDLVNSEFYDYDPFIARDESYLMFASKRPGGYGDCDIYISFKRDDGSWSKAQNMGEEINTLAADFTPIISPDGQHFFFTSWRAGAGDIYWMKAQALRKIMEMLKSGI